MVNQIAKSRADVHFKVREHQRLDAPVARAEYDAAGAAVRARTVRLRELRLAREAALEPSKNKR